MEDDLREAHQRLEEAERRTNVAESLALESKRAEKKASAELAKAQGEIDKRSRDFANLQVINWTSFLKVIHHSFITL